MTENDDGILDFLCSHEDEELKPMKNQGKKRRLDPVFFWLAKIGTIKIIGSLVVLSACSSFAFSLIGLNDFKTASNTLRGEEGKTWTDSLYYCEPDKARSVVAWLFPKVFRGYDSDVCRDQRWKFAQAILKGNSLQDPQVAIGRSIDDLDFQGIATASASIAKGIAPGVAIEQAAKNLPKPGEL